MNIRQNAIDVVKQMVADGQISQEIAEKYFPELKESEDERIRKEITELIMQPTWKTEKEFHKRKELCAWLEKQGHDGKKWIYEDVYLKEKEQLIQEGIDEVLENPQKYNLEKQGEQKPTDKVEPKFKVGNWYQCIRDFFGKGVTFDKNTAYYCAKEGCLQDEYGCHIAIVKDLYDNFKLWTINDAKPGDILYCKSLGITFIMILKCINQNGHLDSYCRYNTIDGFAVDIQGVMAINDNPKPATKEQRDTLFAKMKEAGYEWDAEKKKVKKIEDEEYDGEDYGIDSLYHAQRILEKTLGSVDGYQTDDGILEHKCAITAVKKLYEQKSADWSEEDERERKRVIGLLEGWLSTFKETCYAEDCKCGITWLKSLRPQSHRKPTDAQMNQLKWIAHQNADNMIGKELMTLYDDLKKLTE